MLTMKGKGDQLQGREERDGMKRRTVEGGRNGIEGMEEEDMK